MKNKTSKDSGRKKTPDNDASDNSTTSDTDTSEQATNKSTKKKNTTKKTEKKDGKRLLAPDVTKSKGKQASNKDIVVDEEDDTSITKKKDKKSTTQKVYVKLSPGICLACRDPNKNIATKCESCLSGYKLDFFSNKCVSACPDGCVCDDSGQCSECDDINMDVNFSCKVCKIGYYYDED